VQHRLRPTTSCRHLTNRAAVSRSSPACTSQEQGLGRKEPWVSGIGLSQVFIGSASSAEEDVRPNRTAASPRPLSRAMTDLGEGSWRGVVAVAVVSVAVVAVAVVPSPLCRAVCAVLLLSNISRRREGPVLVLSPSLSSTEARPRTPPLRRGSSMMPISRSYLATSPGLAEPSGDLRYDP